MDRIAVFVDAGYLFAQGSVALVGRKLRRGELNLNSARLLDALVLLATQTSGLPLLRMYWYDGSSSGPTREHTLLANLPNVKLRLGFVNSQGEQKGVDSLIVTDMINLARNRAMSDALLVSGDEDLRVGVQQAQEFGVRVHLLGISPSRGSQSQSLLQEADTTNEWGPSQVAEFLEVCEGLGDQPLMSPQVLTSDVEAVLREVASQVAESVASDHLFELIDEIQANRSTPSEFDKKLLALSRDRLGFSIDSQQKRLVRSYFLSRCESLLKPERAPPSE
jgi:uncharacterized LabA/DUF88 family protein